MIYTVKNKSEGIYKEKGSKFLAYLYPISNEEEIKTHLDVLRVEHSKARHFCYAFRLGGKGETERANDDGEPGGSAGLPILNQLHSAELTNILLVVVRYFGGTKLGVSGLIHAYKESSKDAIDRNRKVEYVEMFACKIRFPISEIGKVEVMIKKHDVQVLSKTFEELSEFQLSCPLKEADVLKNLLSSMPFLQMIS